MTREQLDAIRARVEAATPGPWEAGTAFCCPDMGWIDGPRRMVCPVHETAKRTHTLDSNDAEFVAHAREDVPALLAEVERLTAERDALQVGDTASTALADNERFAPSEHALVYIEKWCDGSGPCAVELEPHGHWRLSRSVSLASVRKAERDAAFKRGVAAMREVAVKECWKASDVLADIPDMESEQGALQNVAYRIRALPDPEDK